MWKLRRARSLCAALVVVASLATAPSAQAPRCATPSRPTSVVGVDNPSDCGLTSNVPNARYAPSQLHRIPVVVHVIQSTTGQGAIPDSLVRSQIRMLNDDFRARPGTNGAPGVDTRIEFRLASVDPTGQPTTGITRSTNDIWFRDRGDYWNVLAWDTSRYMNVYVNNLGLFTLGYVPDLPASGAIVGTAADRVVVNVSVFGSSVDRVLAHEVGHYLGLYHTFAGACTGGPCATSGDLICDTPDHVVTGCSAGPGCSGAPPIHNHMNYTTCADRFTQEQARRMRCTLDNWRTTLGARCAAAATLRNAGANPASLSSTLPILGSTLSATVDVGSTGHSFGALVGGLAAAETAFGPYRVLVDLLRPPGGVLSLPASAGPTAAFQLPIPNDPALCGFTLSLQGVHFSSSGSPALVLSNAIDLVLGRN